MWTSRANDGYLAITGHYIDADEYKMKSALLECVPLLGSHTAQNLSTEIKRVTDEWKITEKVILAVSDNGANIKGLGKVKRYQEQAGKIAKRPLQDVS